MTGTFENDLIQNLTDPEFAKYFGAAQAKSSFAVTLSNARKTLGITQHELAQKAGVSQSYIAKIEGGESNPTLERIGSLLAVIGLSLTTDTTALSPFMSTPITEFKWDIDPLLVNVPENVFYFTDATNGMGSNRTEKVKVS